MFPALNWKLPEGWNRPNVAGPLRGAVQANHTDAPPKSLVPPWDGSPTSLVAPRLLKLMVPRLPGTTRELVRESLSTTPKSNTNDPWFVATPLLKPSTAIK